MGTCLSVDDSSDDDIGCGRSARVRRKQRKQRIMEVLAAEAKNNELLFRMPGRMYLNGSSSNACIFTQQGRKGTNQDAMIVWESFASRTDITFCGVFDGHGPFGHLVAKKVRDSLPSKLSALYKSQARQDMRVLTSATSIGGLDETKGVTIDVVVADPKAPVLENVQNQKTFSVWKDCFLKAYHAMDKELKSHPTIDCFCSGTTSVTMLLQGQDMVIANVGDSRAVLGTLTADDNTKVEAIQLTVDLKPNLPLEAERIKRCKGRVFALEDEPEVARVWLPHDDSPGLAMARAFGDFCLKDFGLIAVPEVTYTRLTERDQFVVLASDGVWDVLSNKEVVETIWGAPTRTTAARSLVETAVRAWRQKYPTSKVDDCAVVCFYLNKQQRRQSQAAIFSCTAMELAEVPDMGVKEGMGPVEFDRSNTLRPGNSASVDGRDAVIDKSNVGIEENVVVEKSSIEDDHDVRAGGNVIIVDDESPSCVAISDNGSSCIHICDDGVSTVPVADDSTCASESIVADSVVAVPIETQHANTPYSSSPSPQEELATVENPPFIVLDDAPSEITVLSEAGEEEEGGRDGGAVVMGRSASRRSLAECLSVADDDEWSALEGVARVNSLLNLPRFLKGDKRTGSPSFGLSKSSRSRKTTAKWKR